MEQFLYDINVDTKASSDRNEHNDGYEDEWNEFWTPPEGIRKKKRRKRFTGGARLRSDILSSCNVVLTTLSSAVSFTSRFHVIFPPLADSSDSSILMPYSHRGLKRLLMLSVGMRTRLTLSSEL